MFGDEDLKKNFEDIKEFLKKEDDSLFKTLSNIETNMFDNHEVNLNKSYIKNLESLERNRLKLINCFSDLIKKVEFQNLSSVLKKYQILEKEYDEIIYCLQDRIIKLICAGTLVDFDSK